MITVYFIDKDTGNSIAESKLHLYNTHYQARAYDVGNGDIDIFVDCTAKSHKVTGFGVSMYPHDNAYDVTVCRGVKSRVYTVNRHSYAIRLIDKHLHYKRLEVVNTSFVVYPAILIRVKER